jgi:hypothetical protein
MSFPPDVSAEIQKQQTEIAFLFQFGFASGFKRVWTGFGRLKTLPGDIWEGVGDLISIEGLSTSLSTTASPGRLIVSGVSAELLAIALGEQDEFRHRPLAIFLQVFRNRQPFANPVSLGLRIMTAMSISRSAGSRTISLVHESPYIGRNQGANGNYTDLDQQSRYPGDRACERTPTLGLKHERWPDY